MSKHSFWEARYRLNRDASIPAVLQTFEETGRIRALTRELREGEKQHIFWESDLAKWLEAVFLHLQKEEDQELRDFSERLIDKLIRNQEADGYLNSYFSFHEPDHKFTNLKVRHELYCAGHLLEAALEHLKLDPDSRFFAALEKYIDHIAQVFGRGVGQKRGYPGHQEIELALLKAYEYTGKAKFLELAGFFLDERGQAPHYFELEDQKRAEYEKPVDYSEFPSEVRDFISWHMSGLKRRDHTYYQAHQPAFEQKTAEGHSVRALYMFTAMADYARLTGDPQKIAACKVLWENITCRRMYVHGGVGSAHIGERFSFDYDLPNDLAYAETCASIALIFFAERLMRIEWNSEYADVIERALYNVVLASTSTSGKAFFYDNYLEYIPDFQKFQHRRHGVRDEYHTCSCCPPNVLRIIADLERYIFSQPGEEIMVNQYINSEKSFDLGDGTISIQMESALPWGGKVRVVVSSNSNQPRKICFRIPSWDSAPKILLNGEPLKLKPESGYLGVEKVWGARDVVEVDLNLTPYVVRADPRVRYNANRVAVFRGPLLYCMESTDNSSHLNQYLLGEDPKFTETPQDQLAPGAIALETEGYRVEPSTTSLYSRSRPKRSRARLRLIPYFLWSNRGECEMLTWVLEDSRYGLSS
jgi:DUF1680 family protein